MTEFETLGDAWINSCYARFLSPKTIERYEAALKRFTRYLANNGGVPARVSQLTSRDIWDFLAYLAGSVKWANFPPCAPRKPGETLSPYTCHQYYRSLKTFLKFCEREGAFNGRPNPINNVKGPKLPKKHPPTLRKEQIEALLIEIARNRNDPGIGNRNLALALFMLDTGCRVGEVVSLTLDKIDWNTKAAWVCGKGNKERIVPLGVTLAKELKIYISQWRHPADDSIWEVFLLEKGTPMSGKRVRRMLYRKGAAAGIKGFRVRPHILRHTFALQFILRGGDAFTLQTILGHEGLETTKRYVKLAMQHILLLGHKHSPVDALAREMKLLPSGEDRQSD